MEFLHTVENTLTVGIPTSGCSLGANHIDFYLPNTGLRLYFGTGLSFNETMENRDGVGYLPDLWVNPVEAPVAVARLCGYYGLKEPVSSWNITKLVRNHAEKSFLKCFSLLFMLADCGLSM